MAPAATEMEFESIPATMKACYMHESSEASASSASGTANASSMSSLDRNQILEEVVQQQADFGEKK